MDDKHLAWFLGPKAENSELFKNTLLEIIQDYIHWRRNYHPSDNLLITKKKQREHSEEDDKLQQNVIEMMAQLRRNFPFYSPRYIGHMLSDVSMPAMLGYFAGMFYNANNVTPEAAPVTVEWEIEACNEILKMLGYTPSPSPPGEKSEKEDWQKYEKEIYDQFGWAHITSGGTVANIEAIWVARIVKYFPLAIQDVANKRKLKIAIYKPNEKDKAKRENRQPKGVSIRSFKKNEVINIKPNETIFLYAKFIEAVMQKEKTNDVTKASKKAAKWLNESGYSLGSHLGKVFNDFPPVIFASGAAHYSVKKAANILGIGGDNVIGVKMDSQFRMDVKDLEEKINKAIDDKKTPLAVVAVGSTTEEGAVDPVHEIFELRKKFENEKNISFWLHVDAAWGGYISSLFRFEEDVEANIILDKILRQINHSELEKALLLPIDEKILLVINLFQNHIKEPSNISKKNKPLEGFSEMIKEILFEANQKNYKSFLNELRELVHKFGSSIFFKNHTLSIRALLDDKIFEVNINDKSAVRDETSKFVKDTVTIGLKGSPKEIKWGEDESIISSFLRFKEVDSITIDPHKMGYVPYPCGVIAFKNDRVRHFIKQDAPYISSSETNELIHNPPRHIKEIDFERLKTQPLPYEKYDLGTDAFGKFILEGSKPGAAAASLWLATKTIPLNRRNHGLIIKSSLLAAREIYEWLNSWDEVAKEFVKENLFYKFMMFGPVPDTNVVIFTINGKLNNTIDGMNKLTEGVYDKFTIHAESGERKHSYEQPFFITKTEMTQDKYDYDCLKNFFEKCNLINAEDDYNNKDKNKELVVLRAAIMNPYITPIRQKEDQNLCREFIMDLHSVAQELARKQISESNGK